jgi:HK97 family phage major capsid protein/HK97 family phage prohead protease
MGWEKGRQSVFLLQKKEMSMPPENKEIKAQKTTIPVEFKSYQDEKGDWIIEGFASTPTKDLDNEVILPKAFEQSLPAFLKNPIMLVMHGWIPKYGYLPVGKYLQAEIKETGLWVKGMISKTAPEIWTLIQEKILKAFSIGFNRIEGASVDVDGTLITNNLQLLEISLAPIPCNPDALFEMAKCKGIDLTTFNSKKEDEEKKEKVSSEEKKTNQSKEEESMPEMKEDLENAVKFIKDVQEKVKEIPTKAELKQFEENVKADLLKVIEEHGKKERKIRFDAELLGNEFAGAGLNHPEVFLAKTPKEKFARLLSVSSTDPRVKEMQKAADDMLLTHILMKKFNPSYAGIKSLAMFERFNQVSSDFRKALDTATSTGGADWIPTNFSAELIDKIRLETKVAGLFQRFTMPTSPYKYPLLTGDATVYYMPESLDDNSEKFPASDVSTLGLTFTARKLVARVLCSEEITEDSIVAVLPILKNNLAKSLAGAVDDVIINGDRTATHQDYDINLLTAKHRQKSITGLRALCAAGAKYDITTGTTGFAATDLRAVRALMGKYAVNPADCVHIMSISGYIQALNFTEVATVDKFGAEATWLKGYLTALDGMPITVSEYVRQDLGAAGVNAASANTYTISILVNKNCYLIGDRRTPTVKVKEEIETDQQILVISQRLDFQPLYAAASNYAVGIAYKITS